ncbi:MAG: protein jag, partial [Anaerolineae bacterium]|nr:protein jag [Anaerolineae bacterium]
YKAKRSRMLHDLALRMADQASRTKRTVALEPMPPYERRIVHMALRSREDVQTKSVGEGNSRKVTIVPR